MDYQKPGVGACVALRKFNGTGNLNNGGEWKSFFPKVLVLVRQKEVAFWSDKGNMLTHVLRRPMVVFLWPI